MGRKPRIVVLPQENIAVLVAFTTQPLIFAVNNVVSTIGLKPKSKIRM